MGTTAAWYYERMGFINWKKTSLRCVRAAYHRRLSLHPVRSRRSVERDGCKKATMASIAERVLYLTVPTVAATLCASIFYVFFKFRGLSTHAICQRSRT